MSSEEEIIKLRQEVKDKDDILNLVKKKEKSVVCFVNFLNLN